MVSNVPSDFGYRITRRPAASFYHGGVAGLAVGSFVLPAEQCPQRQTNDPWYMGGQLNGEWFCFVTTDITQAWHNALLCEAERGAGAVYRVDPVGRLWLDLDEFGENFACRRARILACEGIPEWVRSAYRTDQRTFVEQCLVARGWIE